MTEKNSFRIRWAAKVKRARIWRLYQTDARGLIDADLINESRLGALCPLREHCDGVTEANRVDCPRCRHRIICPEARWSQSCPVVCPKCTWQATYGQWRHSWRHQDLFGGNAMDTFRAYIEKYPQAKSPQAQMLCIDQLINAYHWSQRRQRHHGPAANQLIQGKPEEVLAFLDRLAGHETKSEGLER